MEAILLEDNQLEELKKLAKNYLDITVSDSDMDEKLCNMLQRGAVFLQNRAGSTKVCDTLSKPGQEQTLLLAYCLYDRSGALSDYVKNYASELLGLRIRYQAEEYASEDGGETGGTA